MPRGFPRLRTTDGALNRIGGRVIERRLALGLGQDELCAKLAEVTVTDLEVIALSLALTCEPHWLLMGEPEEPVDFQKPALVSDQALP
jgi:hypothetical protein